MPQSFGSSRIEGKDFAIVKAQVCFEDCLLVFWKMHGVHILTRMCVLAHMRVQACISAVQHVLFKMQCIFLPLQGTDAANNDGDDGSQGSDSEDGLPPLEKNTNRRIIVHEDSDSEGDDDS